MHALEQLGTSISCDGNSTTPAYAAWWEIVPAASVPIPLKIRPGDLVNGNVRYGPIEALQAQ